MPLSLMDRTFEDRPESDALVVVARSERRVLLLDARQGAEIK